MADAIPAKVDTRFQSTGAFMAMGRFEYLPQNNGSEKVDPFKESTKKHPGGIFTA